MESRSSLGNGLVEPLALDRGDLKLESAGLTRTITTLQIQVSLVQIFGEYYHVHLGVRFSRFADEGADMVGGGLEVLGGCDGEELGLAEADYDGVGEGLV